MIKKLQFGKRIKELRLKHELGLRELGRLLKVSAMHISNLEKGRVMPSAELVKKLAVRLDADIDELLHLAKLIDPQIAEVIQKNPYKAPNLLRSAKNLNEKQWGKLQKQVEKMAKENEKSVKK
jgi:transcriptional regulator with XRE-family HTH domain